MTQSTLKAHVAIAALTAALAASATPALAQDAGVVPPPVTTTAPPASSTTIAPPPIVHTVPVTTTDANSAASVPVDPAAAAQAQAEDAARAKAAKPAPKPAAPVERAPIKADAKPVATKQVSAAPAPAPVADSAAPAPMTADAPPLVAPQVQAPPPVEQAAPVAGPAAAGSNIPVGWWIAGGLAAAAIAFALIAFMANRRRRVSDGRVAMDAEHHVTPPLPRASFEPVAVAPAEKVEPEGVPIAAREPLVERSPVMAPATVEAEPVYARQAAQVPVGSAMGRHEAAAMRGPSADNPFLTRRARVRRARFYDRRERLAAEAGRPNPFGEAKVARAAQAARERRPAAAAERKGPMTWPGGYRPVFGES